MFLHTLPKLSLKYLFVLLFQLLEKTSHKTDENITGVERETERLKKENSRCGWGVWLLMLLVFAVFIGMVFFIRIVPKPRY